MNRGNKLLSRYHNLVVMFLIGSKFLCHNSKLFSRYHNYLFFSSFFWGGGGGGLKIFEVEIMK